MPSRVAALVSGKHPLPYMARSVSGTFDVDRCDYLLRDAHATGVRYGEYDLPWLLRSFRFGQSTRPDEAPGLAIDGTKGLSAIESFILARYFMFQQVYFHKSTRAAEWMIGAILRRALALLRDGTRLPHLPPAMATIAAESQPTLGEYLELDDEVLLGAIYAWQDAKDPILADLCRRLRARELFKTVELLGGRPDLAQPDFSDGAPESELSPATALAIARDLASAAGLDPDVYVGLDVASDTPFSDDGSLMVLFPKGRPRRPVEVSFLLNRMRDETITRHRVIFPHEIRDAVREALIR
jgi:HD superfamily phosphohydrolase